MAQVKKDSLKIKLTDLKVKSSYINEFDNQLEINVPDEIRFSIKGGLNVDKENDTILSQVVIDAFYQKTPTSKKIELFGIMSETHFMLEKIDKVFIDGELRLPRDFATKIFNISIGNTRGLLKGFVAGNAQFANCTLPLITAPVFEEVDMK